MTKKYLVTGGAGFIGAHLVRNLLDSKNKVIALDNFKRSVPRRIKEFEADINFKCVNVDIRNFDEIEGHFTDVDCVYHLAAINGTENFYNMPIEILDVGILGIINVIKACDLHSVPNLIAASSAEVYQTPDHVPTTEEIRLVIPDIHNPRYSYGLSKIVTESYCLNYKFNNGTRTKIFRPHNIYGPDMGLKHVIPQFISNMIKVKKNGLTEMSIKGSLEATRAFCFVEDLVLGLRILESSSEDKHLYHIGTQEEVKIKDLIEIISSLLKIEINKIDSDHTFKGETLRRCPDTTKIESLGFKPSTGLHEGIRKTFEWYINNNEDESLLL